jgi:hypothetical protein
MTFRGKKIGNNFNYRSTGREEWLLSDASNDSQAGGSTYIDTVRELRTMGLASKGYKE